MTNGSEFYFIYSDNALAGYLKINYAPAQSDINDPDSVEIERIYVGVWEKNKDAISFYKYIKYKITGEHQFKVGNEMQTDLIMRKEIAK